MSKKPIIHFFLAFVLILSSFPLDGLKEVSAVTNNQSSKTKKEESVAKAPSVEKKQRKEIKKNRKEKEKVVDNGDGTYTKDIYSKPIHKKNNKGEFEEINSNLIVEENKIKPINTLINAEFNKEVRNEDYVSFKDGSYYLNYKMVNASNGETVLTPNTTKAKYKDNLITYHNVYPNIDLRNIITDSAIKEDIVINKKTKLDTFRFNVNTNLTPILEENGSISFVNENQQVKFMIPKPFMTDSNINKESAEAPRSENVNFEIEKTESNTWSLSIKVDKEWLLSKERVYPIYVDPTTKTAATTHDTFVSDAYPTANYGSSWDSSAGFYSLKVGKYDASSGLNYAYLKQDVTPFKYSIIDSATLKLYTGHSYYVDTPTGVWVDEVGGTTTWSEGTMNWNNKPPSKTANIASDTVYRGQWAEFPVTNTVKNWVEGKSTNYGFKIHTSTFGTSYWKKFYSSENSSNKPVLSVTYHYPTTSTPTSEAYTYGNTSNTGYVDLKWNAVPGASSYKVLIFNGKVYEEFPVGNVTSWSTKNQKIWPSPQQIQSEGFKGLKHNKDGIELPEDPSYVYKASGGGTYDTRKNYAMKVIAVYPGGESAASEGTVPTIPVLETPAIPIGSAFSNGDGTGYVNVNWSPVSGATGYKVWIFNGKTYQSFDAGNSTTWTSKGKKLYPTATELTSKRYLYHTDSLGTELSSDPSVIYRNAGNTTYENTKNYWILVSAYNAHGSTINSGSYRPTIPNTTVPTRPSSPTGSVFSNFKNNKYGFVDLKWDKIVGADGYKLWIFNGKEYQSIDVGNVTSWSTKDQDIWPTILEIAAGNYQLHTTPNNGIGTDLATNPNLVYVNSGGNYQTFTNYWFRLSAYNEVGESSYSSTAFMPHMPKTTDFLGTEEYLQSISIPKGSANPLGNFVFGETDLSIEGKGPSNSISRTYNSLSTNKGIFGQGWISNLEVSLKENQQGNIIFTDEDGTNHQFIKDYKTPGAYISPTGKFEKLTKNLTNNSYVIVTKEQLNYNFNNIGKLVDITDAHNNKYSLTYNTNNQLSSLKDPSGRNITLTYNTEGFVSVIKDFSNQIYSYNYFDNKLVEVVYPENKISKFSYNADGQLASVQEPGETNKTEFLYGDNRIESVVDENGSITKLNYNDSLGIVEVVDPKNTSTQYFYNEKGNPLKVIEDTKGIKLTTQYEYKDNLLINTIDSKGISTSSVYDNSGNIIEETDGEGNQIFYEYDEKNNLISSQDALGNRTENVYNTLGDLISSTDPDGTSSFYTYDQFGNQLSIKDPEQNLTEFTYDTSGNYLIQHKDQLQKSVTSEYNNLGNKTAFIDGKGQKSTYLYNANNLLTNVTDPKLNKTSFNYDSFGNLSSITNAKNNTISFKYDESGNLVSTTNPLEQSSTFSYDKNGNKTQEIDGSGNTLLYNYDSLNRVNEYYINGVKEFAFSYDKNNNLSTVINWKNNDNIFYNYNDNNKLIELRNGVHSLGYDYDANNNLLKLNIFNGVSTASTEYQYNELNRVTALFSNGQKLIGYGYDQRENNTSISRANGTQTYLEYDAANELNNYKNYDSNGALLSHYKYELDENGNWINIATKEGVISYEYNNLIQLTKETFEDGTSISYEYDSVGNRTKKTHSNDASKTAVYSYNKANQLINVNGRSLQYDSNGNLITDGEKLYFYDAENQLVEIKSILGTSLAKYTYDHNGYRIKTETTSETIKHYYSGDKLIYETDAQGNIIAEYSWGVAGPETMTRNGMTYYYHTNGHGDVTLITDSSSNIVATYKYDAWGNVIDETGSLINPLRYAGYYFDSYSELYYLSARYYNPMFGVFLSKDPILGDLQEPLTLNGYNYANNNPIMFKDPSGKKGYRDGEAGYELGQSLADWLNRPKKINFTKKGVDHVKKDHRNPKKAKDKSQWTVSDWQYYAKYTFKHYDRWEVERYGRYTYQRAYSKALGVNKKGKKLYKVKVTLERDGDLVTTYPLQKFQSFYDR
ncbi:DNRLRE domain-containing protein [Bacillus sp. E(2018)]|uniref:DNRLRE domain-containing protein n=1 Tax=Bacillus sp. E(2018) TaxID=2502239 RepID=UPI0010F4F3E1|nr:DNRLRE domain-containing protein [Bacillus sp. E(2018)]